MSNLGRWDNWYRDLEAPEAYGSDHTYRLGADWLEGLDVEDWGCGKGWMRRFVQPEHYRGVDGSWSPFADAVVDLEMYRSDPPTPGLFMRHVLEHNYEWRRILDNALASFTYRMALVFFTPFGAETRELSHCAEIDVPEISFCVADVMGALDAAGVGWRLNHLNTSTYFGVEHIFYIWREPGPAPSIPASGPLRG